jgi:hypothetical protein
VEALSILDSIAGFAAAQASGQSANRPWLIGTIDPAYVASSYPGTQPKVTFDGESTLSGKTYKVLAPGYWPTAGDRVVLAPVGTTYVIVGSVTNAVSAYVGGSLAVTGSATMANNLTVSGSAAVTGNVAVGGTTAGLIINGVDRGRGFLTGVTSNSASTNFTTGTEIVLSTAPSAVFRDGRVYEVQLSGLGVNTVSGSPGVANLHLRKGTTNAGTEWINFGNMVINSQANVAFPGPTLIGNNTGSDITTQCCLTGVTNTGTCNVNAVATNPRGFRITDVGSVANLNGVAPISFIT